MKKQIPNLITLCNLLCGTVATAFAVQHRLDLAALWILLGILFDFFDGLTARLLHVASPLGKELDSLADVVTSGVAPGFILYSIFWQGGWGCFSYVALIIPAFAAYRLAKFNIDTRQSHSFLGLPVPSNAIVWTALGICKSNLSVASLAMLSTRWFVDFCFSPVGLIVLLLLALICCMLMISEVPLFGLKFKNLRWADNKTQFLFLLTAVVLIVLWGVVSLPLIILWYIVLSLCTQKKHTA